MPSQLSPQGGVLGSPQSLVLQISGPIFLLIQKKTMSHTVDLENIILYCMLPSLHLPVIVFIPKDCILFPLKRL